MIALAFNEPLFFQPPPDIRVYTGFNYTTRVAVTNMTYAFTDRPRIFLWISGFVWGEDYLVVINDVYDARRNVIFPNTRIGVSWPSTTILVPLSSLWDFHNSYVFDRSIYSNSPPWYARDYSTTSSAWWARGSGLFAFSTALPTTFCETLPSFTTISFQPEPVLFRHSFVAPPGVKSNATLLLTYNVVHGLVLYLNGVEIHQFNSEPTPVTASSRALTNYSGNCRFRIAVNVSSLLPGTNWLAAAVLNLDQAIQTVFGLSVDLYSLPTSPVPPDPPHDQCLLTIAPEGPNLRLSWPIDFSGYGLQYKTNLNPNLPWLTISNQANPYRAPQTEETRFYRLSKGGLQ